MAGFETKSKTIGGSKFTVAPLTFGKGREGLSKLFAVIAPAIGDGLSRGMSVTALLGNSRVAGIFGDMLAALPQRLDEATMKWFENEFGAKTTAEIGDVRVEIKLDTEANRGMAFESLGYMAFFQWLSFCLEVNYAGFFGEALAVLGKPSAKPQAQTK